ncbi:MAG TPA: alpha-amylase family glycosyl hydrolase [Anaerolineales bacterium]|nr:alpha-amylase family glycosyl hydrolase [Anaerolineales bacterium]
MWWKSAVFYQIYPRSFADSNQDGVGDLPGITQKIPYLASLGVDALWLSPVYPSPQFDFGYDVADYCDIDPLFGTLTDFDQLVATAHHHNLRIVMDLVFNHTSHLHDWFKESRQNRRNAKRNWYIWADPGLDGGTPNNWESVFGGSAWEWDELTGQFYLHSFLKEQPDLNWRNPEVRQAIYAVMRFWLERGVDGFRMDVVNVYYKDAALRDNPLVLGSGISKGLRSYDRQRHIYDRDQPEMEQTLGEMRALLDFYQPPRMMVGEIMGEDTGIAARYCASNQLNLAFNFEFSSSGWRPRNFQKIVQKWESTLGVDNWPCYVLSNHDIVRHVSRYADGPHAADQKAVVAAALLLTLRGTPFLYYGEEIAMRNVKYAREQIQDPFGKQFWPFYTGRDGCRSPMQWSGAENAGFCENAKPWLPLAPDFAERNLALQQENPTSIWHQYRQLLAIRRAESALQQGEFVPLQQRNVESMVFLRQTADETILVALNFYGWEVTAHLDQPLPSGEWQTLYNTLAEQPAPAYVPQTLILNAYQVAIWKRKP